MRILKFVIIFGENIDPKESHTKIRNYKTKKIKKLLLFILLSLFLFPSCSDSEDIENAKNISIEWVKSNVLPLYDENLNAIILSTKDDIEKQVEVKYLAKKYKWKGALEDNGYKFSENSDLILSANKIYDDYTTYATLTDITDEKIAYKNYLYEWMNRVTKLYESSDCEMKIDKTEYFYVIRLYIKYKDNNPDNTSLKYRYDRIDVILDDNFNVINKLDY